MRNQIKERLALVAVLATTTFGPACNFSLQVRSGSDEGAKTETMVPTTRATSTPIELTVEPTATSEEPMVVWTPEMATPESVEEVEGCGQARDLGPWALSEDGKMVDFEVTAGDDSAGVVLGLWWSGRGVTSVIEINERKIGGWGTDEITTFVPRGLSIRVPKGAGRAWDFPDDCSQAEVERQMQAHIQERKDDTNYHGEVDVDDLIRLGVVEVRFDRRAE